MEENIPGGSAARGDYSADKALKTIPFYVYRRWRLEEKTKQKTILPLTYFDTPY